MTKGYRSQSNKESSLGACVKYGVDYQISDNASDEEEAVTLHTEIDATMCSNFSLLHCPQDRDVF